MKVFTSIFVLILLEKCSTYLIKVPTKPAQPNIVPVIWQNVQKLILPLFENVCEESTDETVLRLDKEFDFDSASVDYTKSDVVDNLQKLNSSNGLLPKGEIFSEYNRSHLYELKILYDVFYYAKDFDTFYKAASWARQNINCGLFVDAIYLAVVTRKDTSKISIPAPYELIPNYFIQKDVIIKASSLLSGEDLPDLDDIKVENNAYILDANYTSDMDDEYEDSNLAYFREDIGLNSYYFLRKLINAPWLNIPTDANNNYGDIMFFMMKQLAARYDLERYSNKLEELESLNWDSVVDAYDPKLIYSNGNEFSHRTISGISSNTDDITYIKTIENSLSNITAHLRQAGGHNKIQILNHLIDVMVTSEESYENYARRLLNQPSDMNERQYSTLDHYLTTVRDPIFWRINKKIVELIDNALKVLPGYTRKDLHFPGVEILNIETKKLMTSFESFQFDVTDSLKTIHANTTFQVKIAQTRLDHKTFTMKLNISSLVTQTGLVRIYIGPKTMPGEFVTKKNLFVLIDKFKFNLKRGINIISRSSDEMTCFSKDFISLRVLRKKVEDAEFGLESLPSQDIDRQIEYPSRLVLPKGWPEGLPLQVFAFIAPLTKSSLSGSYLTGNMDYNTPILSAGYPFDLNVDENQMFNLPNALLKDIAVTHKGAGKTSLYNDKAYSKKWDANDSFGPKQFDYTAKREYNYKNYQDEVEEESYDRPIENVHSLLGARPAFTYRNTTNDIVNKKQFKKKEKFPSNPVDIKKQELFENSLTDTENVNINSEPIENTTDVGNILNKIKTSLINPKLYNNKENDIGYDMTVIKNKANDLILNGKPFEPFETTTDKTTDIFHKSYNKWHTFLGVRPDFTYKKDTLDYSSKRNQYKEKKEKYGTIKPVFKKGDYPYSDINKVKEKANVDLVIDTEKVDVKNNDVTKKNIIIDDNNNLVMKNISENKYINKSNGEITKEIVDNLTTEKSNIVEKDIQYSTNKNYDDYVEDSGYPVSYDDDISVIISEEPKKRVTIYDFLFNNIPDEEKVYE
ncbi:unnamed protein product [Diatraea saccharalis]|uniref:Hexamerin n=1 Tax=Diatraea saccharalis TaxID=40085 RepID=A0A9N9WDL4_9NEOP|nr:unnamed protein product [Diatraea saccharalis]